MTGTCYVGGKGLGLTRSHPSGPDCSAQHCGGLFFILDRWTNKQTGWFIRPCRKSIGSISLLKGFWIVQNDFNVFSYSLSLLSMPEHLPQTPPKPPEFLIYISFGKLSEGYPETGLKGPHNLPEALPLKQTWTCKSHNQNKRKAPRYCRVLVQEIRKKWKGLTFLRRCSTVWKSRWTPRQNDEHREIKG